MARDPVDMLSFTSEDLKMLNEDMKLVVARCSLVLKWTSNTTRKMTVLSPMITHHIIDHMLAS